MEPSKDIDRRDTLNLGDKKFVTKLLKSGGNFWRAQNLTTLEKLIWTGELTKINKRKRS